MHLLMSNCNISAKMPRPLPSLALILLALPLLIVSGCANQPFPSNWAKPETALPADGCSGLSGTYANGATLPALFDVLSAYPNTRTQADRVELKVPDSGILTAVAYNGGEPVGELRFSKHDQSLVCRADGADVLAGGLWARESMWGYSKIKISLYKDKDGNLLASNQESGVGVYGLIPLPGSSTNWYRFPPCISTVDKPCLQTEEKLAEIRAARAKRSKIHVYRTQSFWAGAQPTAITLDGRRVGHTTPVECVILEVVPGAHEISAIGENTSKLSLTTETAKSYYLRQEVTMGWVKPVSQLHAVDEETGRKHFAECMHVRSYF